MKLIVLTNEEGPETRAAWDLADNVSSEGYEVEKLDWESDEAASLSSLHDIYSTPAFLLVRDDGSQLDMWQGEHVPLAADIKHLM